MLISYKKGIVGVLILAISMLHFDALTGKLSNELLHSELYFFPILLAGLWFGLKGGSIAAMISSIVCTFQFFILDAFDNVLTALISQILVFVSVGLFVGYMVERQERSRKERDSIKTKLMEERLQQRAFKIELETASKIQSLFRPKLPSLGSGSQVWAFSQPAKSVGGDLFDVIPMEGNSWLVYVADVSDKGLPAALIMAALWTHIRTEVHLHEDMGKLLTALNKPFHDLVADEGYFATVLIGRYWPETGKLEYANAGHPPPIKFGPNRFELVDGQRYMSLGVFEDSKYECHVTFLAKEDAIFFMTDGITEAMDNIEPQECLNRIYQEIKTNPPVRPGTDLLDLIQSCGHQPDQSDDLTLLAIWRKSETSNDHTHDIPAAKV
jgi:serine phosphatase RsbU (regulator of sigma subunit)